MKKILLLFTVGWSVCAAQSPKTTYPFRDTTLTVDERVEDLISRLTLSEKVQMMKHQSPAIERLGVPAYNWWNEAFAWGCPDERESDGFPASHRFSGNVR